METKKSASAEIVKPHLKSNVPASDVDFGNVANTVSLKWDTSPWLTLLYTNSEKFAQDVASFRQILSSRQQVGANRPQITKALEILDKKIDDALAYVKGYIIDKYKKEAAPSYYPQFGIVHKTNKYVFPSDQNSRSAALDLMISGINENGFNDKEFGAAFWLDIKEKYNILLIKATSTDGTVSEKVGDKNALKSKIKKVLNSLILNIKSNYPETYKTELRNWGFQKEKY
jgi:hypothetical protein